MRVKFILDKNYDTKVIWSILHSESLSNARIRAKEMGFDAGTANQIIQSKKYALVFRLIREFAAEKYLNSNQQIKSALSQYQKEWDKINFTFSKTIKTIARERWKHRIFKVVLSPINFGVSNMGGDIVIRSALEDPKDQLRITAHEILMSFLWSLLYKKFPEAKNDKFGYFWILNEITTNCILGLEPRLNKLWSKKTKGFDNFLKNYPKLIHLKERLKIEYLKEKKLDNYLKSALSIIKEKSPVIR